jgi:hypothetical protein
MVVHQHSKQRRQQHYMFVLWPEAGKDHPTHVNKWKIYANGAHESWGEHAPMKCIGSHSTNFVEKAQHAEKAGALALVVINR